MIKLCLHSDRNEPVTATGHRVDGGPRHAGEERMPDTKEHALSPHTQSPKTCKANPYRWKSGLSLVTLEEGEVTGGSVRDPSRVPVTCWFLTWALVPGLSSVGESPPGCPLEVCALFGLVTSIVPVSTSWF